jgi:hypothetical protein
MKFFISTYSNPPESYRNLYGNASFDSTTNSQSRPAKNSLSAKMVSKNEFLDSLKPLTCSICLDPYDTDHVAVELPGCSHIFGAECITNLVESNAPSNDRCPLCRKELYKPEDINDVSESSEFGESSTDEEGEWEDHQNDYADLTTMHQDHSPGRFAEDEDDEMASFIVMSPRRDRWNAETHEMEDSDSDYEPSEYSDDSDHEQDDQWRAKLRPEEGGQQRSAAGRR